MIVFSLVLFSETINEGNLDILLDRQLGCKRNTYPELKLVVVALQFLFIGKTDPTPFHFSGFVYMFE